MKKWLVVLFGFGLMGIAEDHGTPSESPTASARSVETPLSTPPVNVNQFLSQEVGKALIANQGDIKNTKLS